MRSQWLRISSQSLRNGSAGAIRTHLRARMLPCRLSSSTATPTSPSAPLSPPSPPPPAPSAPSSTTSVSSTPSSPPTRTAVHPSILEKSPRRRELQSLLAKLSKADSAFNSSEMYLATNQLEEDEPMLRISLVGLEQASRKQESTAERIAKILLLAEDMSEKETEWERSLKGSNLDWAGMAIRYNAKAEIVDPGTSTPQAIHIPNPLLQPSTELVVANLDPSSDYSSPLDPEVMTWKAGIVYPVHKAIVVVNNFEELLSRTQLWKSEGVGEAERIRIVVDVDKVTLAMVPKMEADTSGNGRMFICTSMAQEALDAFRTGRGSIDAFKKSVEESGMARLAEYIKSLAVSQPEGEDKLPEHLRQLIFTIVMTHLPDIPRYTTQSTKSASLAPGNSRKELQEAVASWSRASHSELTKELDAGYTTKPYRRISWVRLLLNVDDVRCACESVVRGFFLRDAERKSWFLAGRVAGAGYSLPDDITVVQDAMSLAPPGETSASETSISATATDKDTSAQAIGVGRDSIKETQAKSQITPSSHLHQHAKSEIKKRLEVFQPQYPSHISDARNRIIKEMIPPFARQAQFQITKFLSSATLASATGVLMYLSEFSLYSSLSVFSLLAVYSVRRLQVGWGRAKREWEMGVRDEGRKAIAGVEDWVGVCLSNAPIDPTEGKSKEEVRKMQDEARKKWNDMSAMVSKAKRLLEEM